jgi:hypothetical protein
MNPRRRFAPVENRERQADRRLRFRAAMDLQAQLRREQLNRRAISLGLE